MDIARSLLAVLSITLAACGGLEAPPPSLETGKHDGDQATGAALKLQILRPASETSAGARRDVLQASVVAEARVVSMSPGRCAEYLLHSDGRDWITGMPESQLDYWLKYEHKPGLVLTLDKTISLEHHRRRTANKLCIPTSSAETLQKKLGQLAHGSRLFTYENHVFGVRWTFNSTFSWAYKPNGEAIDEDEDLYQPKIPVFCVGHGCTVTAATQRLSLTIGEGELFAQPKELGIIQPTSLPELPQIDSLSALLQGHDLRLLYELELAEQACAGHLGGVGGAEVALTLDDRAFVRASQPGLDALRAQVGECIVGEPVAHGFVSGFDANGQYGSCVSINSVGTVPCSLVLDEHYAKCQALGLTDDADWGQRCADCSSRCTQNPNAPPAWLLRL